MALPQLQASGSNAYVAWLINQDYSNREILSRLRERYPGQHPNTYTGALNQGWRAYQAATDLQVGGPHDRVPASQIPLGPPGGRDYRYYTIVDFQDPSTGERYSRAIQTTSAINLTQSQLYALAEHQAQLMQQNRTPRIGYELLPLSALVSGIEILAIERA